MPSNWYWKLLIGAPLLFLCGLFMTATETFAEQDIGWQGRVIGPVMTVLSPILFLLAYKSPPTQQN